MSNNSNIFNKKLVNVNNTQQHPFHVLHSSKLPIIVASIAGSLALIFIIKIHDINLNNIFYFSAIISTVVDPFYSIDTLTFFSTNILIIFFLTFLLIAI
jgi:hypothetical protein